MSLAFVTRAMMAHLPAIPKLVLIVLADCATENGAAKPAMTRIVNLVGCAEHEVSSVIRQFNAIGLVHGKCNSNPRLPNQFVIDVEMLDRLAIPGMWRRLIDDRGVA